MKQKFHSRTQVSLHVSIIMFLLYTIDEDMSVETVQCIVIMEVNNGTAILSQLFRFKAS